MPLNNGLAQNYPKLIEAPCFKKTAERLRLKKTYGSNTLLLTHPTENAFLVQQITSSKKQKAVAIGQTSPRARWQSLATVAVINWFS